MNNMQQFVISSIFCDSGRLTEKEKNLDYCGMKNVKNVEETDCKNTEEIISACLRNAAAS